ncbi:hypothetical protein NCS57_00460600 [Fusarium keratoplasticum]|uniref:Uncharacterized protein n=1 Tax=Fusarium keratoplasticum TaxID=1328300 RepID=A0ACC0R7B1_9HYPO|nr:hypothetical protein NCS57_00460600 [Fusarium keratoplasticum]KAI8675589.1 hypothetical protein NCS57_00460600 [Fusarium keratoplasticum]
MVSMLESQVLYIQCSVLWATRAIFYTAFVCISYRLSQLRPTDECLEEITSIESEESGESASCILDRVPGWYAYFLNVVFAAWPEYLILHLLVKRADVDELVEFFVQEDVELDMVSIASSDYS